MVLFQCALLGKAGVAQMVNDGDSWKSSSSRVLWRFLHNVLYWGGIGVNWWFWGVSLPFFLCQVVADDKSKASGLLVGVGGSPSTVMVGWVSVGIATRNRHSRWY